MENNRSDYKLYSLARRAAGPDGPYVKTAIPLLVDSFISDYGHPRCMGSIKVLESYGLAAEPALARALASPDASVRIAAASAFEFHMRAKTHDVVSGLLKMLTDSPAKVRVAAASSIENVPALGSIKWCPHNDSLYI